MKLSLSQKLVLAFLSLTLIVLFATLGLARWSFDKGFLDYVNALEQQRLGLTALELEREYISSNNSWNGMTDRVFGDLLREGTRNQSRQAGSHMPRDNRMPPPDFEDGPGRRPPPPSKGASQPTALFDTDNNFIVGLKEVIDSEEYISVPISVNDVVVGELRSTPRREINSPLETAFSKQQLNRSILIGFGSLILATLLSLWLAKTFLAPIRRMSNSISSLANGDYSSRMQEERSDELGQLMADIDTLGNTLEKNRSSRQRWIADISHELRTPLTILIGEINALKDGIRPFDQEQLKSLDQETQRLNHLVNDLYELSLSDIGGLRYEFENVNLSAFISEALPALQKRALSKDLDISFKNENQDSTSLFINADQKRLQQLFTNLIQNSIAYTDAPGFIDIKITQLNNKVILTVQDSPPGVTKNECELLFEPLYRQDASRSRRTAGAGLGLAICKNIVEAHQGSISASPSKLGGLAIEITLPMFQG